MEEVFSKLRANLGDIVALKKSGEQDLIGAKTHSMNGSLLLVDFKQANREAYESVHDLKEETHGIKIELDQAHLQLQNLQYQKSYFLKEIRSCNEFASAFSDKQIDMLPEKEFLQKTPKELTQDADGNPLDAHNLMLKRLACELDERKQLCQTLEELKNRKKALEQTVTGKRKLLQGFGSQLSQLKKATLPLQQHLEVPYTQEMKQKRLTNLLPASLYILYSQLLAVKEAFGEPIEVVVVGKASVTEAFNLKLEAAAQKGAAPEEQGKRNKKADDDVEEDDQRHSRKKRARVEKEKEDVDLMQVYPLVVELKLVPEALHIRFEYLTQLRIVSAETRNGDKSVLINLFPGDAGIVSPNTANSLLSSQLTFEDSQKRPFKWVQHLAGLDFLPTVPPALYVRSTEQQHDSASISAAVEEHRQQRRVRSVLAALRERCAAQSQLKAQLEFLSQLKSPLDQIPARLAQLLPQCKSVMYEWKELSSTPPVQASDVPAEERATKGGSEGEVTAEEGGREKLPEDGELLEDDGGRRVEAGAFADLWYEDLWEKAVGGEDEEKTESAADAPFKADDASETFAEVAMKRFQLGLRTSGAKVEIEATVAIPVEYPVRPPRFHLSLKEHPASGPLSAEARNDLHTIERQVNCNCLKALQAEERYQMLSFQVVWLMCCIDKHAEHELWCGGDGIRQPGERVCRGRDRRKMLPTLP